MEKVRIFLKNKSNQGKVLVVPNIKMYYKSTLNKFDKGIWIHIDNLKHGTKSPEYECVCKYNTNQEYKKLTFKLLENICIN